MKFFFIIQILIIFVSCNNSNKIAFNSNELISDSIILFNKSIDFSMVLKQNDSNFIFINNDSLFCLKNGKLQFIEFPFDKGVKKYLNLTGNWYLNRNENPEKFIYFNDTKINSFDKPKIFVNGNRYLMQTHSYNSFFKLNENQFITPLLYLNPSDYTTYSEFFNNSNKDKLGLFKLEKDSLILLKLLDFFPRKNFFINERRSLGNYLPSLTQSSTNYYLVYNFMDSIFEYNKDLSFKSSIDLPKQLKFKQIDNNPSDLIDYDKKAKMELVGDKNIKLMYNKNKNQLLLITVIGISLDTLSEILPSYDNLNWKISLYDLKTKKWIKIISLKSSYDFRNVFFDAKFIYLKRNNKNEKIIFDKILY